MNSPGRISTQNAQAVDTAGAKARFTAAEFLQMVVAGAFVDMRVELVDGELERMNRPLSAHSGRQGRVIFRLMSLLGEASVMPEIAVIVDESTVLTADIAVVRAPVSDNRMLSPDDVTLVVEIAETTVSRDLGMKRAKYAAAGIGEYWVVDGARSIVHVFAEPIDGQYAANRTVRFGEPLAVPGSERTIVLD